MRHIAPIREIDAFKNSRRENKPAKKKGWLHRSDVCDLGIFEKLSKILLLSRIFIQGLFCFLVIEMPNSNGKTRPPRDA